MYLTIIEVDNLVCHCANVYCRESNVVWSSRGTDIVKAPQRSFRRAVNELSDPLEKMTSMLMGQEVWNIGATDYRMSHAR